MFPLGRVDRRAPLSSNSPDLMQQATILRQTAMPNVSRHDTAWQNNATWNDYRSWTRTHTNTLCNSIPQHITSYHISCCILLERGRIKPTRSKHKTTLGRLLCWRITPGSPFPSPGPTILGWGQASAPLFSDCYCCRHG